MKSVARELSLFLRFGEQIKNQCVHAPAVPFLGCKSSEHSTAALSVEKPGLWHLPASSTRRLDLWRMAVIVQMDREYWWLKVSKWLRIKKWSRKWLLPTERLQLNPWSITLEGIIIIATDWWQLSIIDASQTYGIFLATEGRWLSLLVVRKPRSRTFFFLVNYLPLYVLGFYLYHLCCNNNTKYYIKKWYEGLKIKNLICVFPLISFLSLSHSFSHCGNLFSPHSLHFWKQT